MIRRILGAAALFVAPASGMAQDVPAGAELYRFHCATCHGIEGTGNGPMAGVMLIKPNDLTKLQSKNDGVFPTEAVVRRIDGRDPLISHGSPMPVFGLFFEGDDAALKMPDGQPMLTSRPIVDLVAYLQTLQSD